MKNKIGLRYPLETQETLRDSFQVVDHRYYKTYSRSMGSRAQGMIVFQDFLQILLHFCAIASLPAFYI